MKEILEQNNKQMYEKLAQLKMQRNELTERLGVLNSAISELQGRTSQNEDILGYLDEQEKEDSEE